MAYSPSATPATAATPQPPGAGSFDHEPAGPGASQQENIDTTSATGQLIFPLFASLAEFERDLIRERVQAGLKAARVRGRKRGRKAALGGPKLERASQLMAEGHAPVSEIAKIEGVDRTTLYCHLDSDGMSKQPEPAPTGP